MNKFLDTILSILFLRCFLLLTKLKKLYGGIEEKVTKKKEFQEASSTFSMNKSLR
jgi:hypothetical protein